MRPASLESLEDRVLFAAHAPVAELSEAQVDDSTAVLTDLYLFGDSLSDVGDLYEATGGLIPQAPYFDGRFSNGLLWAEQLAESLSLDLTDETNWAIGGAKTGFDNLADQPGIIEFPGMLDRVQQYVATLGPEGADPDALYAVWGGSNDFLGLTSFDPATIQATLESAVTNIVTAVGTLASVGAEHILVPNLPNLGLVPLGAMTGFGAELTMITAAFNSALDAALDQLELAGIDTIRLDTFAVHNQIVADPASFGLTDALTPFLAAGPGASVDDYLFFDDQHPTEAGHEIIAAAARDAIYESGLLPSIELSAGQKVQFIDATGNRVTVKLSGPGSGEVRLLGSSSDAAEIVLNGTTLASSLHIQVAGGKKGGTTVYDLDVNGSLGKIVAPHVDIIGDVTVSGSIGMMHVDDFIGARAQSIELRGAQPGKRNAFKLIADNPRQVTIETEGSVKSVGLGKIKNAAASLTPLLESLRGIFQFRLRN